LKILHSSDWHLGQRFFDETRLEEQKSFLDYLLNLIKTENIQALIIAGDIFDTANPSRDAEKLYYDFLLQCSKFNSFQIIIIAGNHDSASHLEAPKRLLESLNIYVIGALPDDIDELLIPLGTDKSNPKAWLAAVPFLRDRDVRQAVIGEQFDDMQSKTTQGIINCYKNISDEIQNNIKSDTDIPIIATGHLSLLGSTISESERSIHIGNLGSISDKRLSDCCFDYLALGHLHSPQSVGKSNKIFYSGSPIPLSFSEIKPKEIQLITIKKNKLHHRAIQLPTFRRLIKLRGNYAEINAKLISLGVTKTELIPWVEISITQTDITATEQNQLRDIAQKNNALILKIGLDIKQQKAIPQIENNINLQELSPQQVFQHKLSSIETELNTEELLNCFNKILEDIQNENS